MKKEWMKSFLAVVLVLALTLGLSACGSNAGGTGGDVNTAPPAGEDAGVTTPDAEKSGDEVSFYVADNDEEIYFNNLSEFYDAYQAAMATSNVAERHALLAVAEAKALESGVCTPMYGPTANYNMTRSVYRSTGYASWRGGMNDYSQYVLTNEIIAAEDYEYTKTLWKELCGTGTYIEKAKEYLVEKGYTFKDTFVGTFAGNPTTWNILAAATMIDLNFLRPLLDYLFVYNAEGDMVPHLATGFEISDDGLTYTVHIREGVSWVDSQGRKVADLVADDWVATAQHRADVGQSWTLGLYVAGMTEYANGEITDFSTVGVKAIDTYTLEYTLVEPMTYFHTMFESNDFIPLCRNYFLSQGGAFGLAEYAEASASPSYTYGIDQNHIAYVGKFLCTNMTEKNSANYVLNESYWDKDNTTIKYVKLVYDDGTDVTRTYDNFKNGVTVSIGLSSATMEIAKNNGDFDKYAVVGDVGRASFLFWFNLHRQTYANLADGAAPSQKTDAGKELSEAAFQNTHFRLAIGHAIDRASFIAVNVGEDLKYLSLRNSITPGTYVTLTEDATIEINGKSVTFPAGTWFGEIVQAQLDADDFPVQIWDDVNKTTEGWDAWYNPELALTELNLAIEELEALGFEVSADNPIIIDYPYASYSEVGQNQAYVLKTSIETALDGLVRFDLLPLNNTSEFYNVANNTNYGSERNYDMGGLGTIGSSHGDPKCYTEGILPYGDGALTQYMGLW